MKTLIVALLLTLSSQAFAIDKDKQLHFGVSFLFGAGAAMVMPTPIQACVVGMVPGFLKEVADQVEYEGSGFDGEDMVYNIAGSCLGAYVTHKLIR